MVGIFVCLCGCFTAGLFPAILGKGPWPKLGKNDRLTLARRLRAKFWPDCAIPDTSMKFGTVVDHD